MFSICNGSFIHVDPYPFCDLQTICGNSFYQVKVNLGYSSTLLKGQFHLLYSHLYQMNQPSFSLIEQPYYIMWKNYLMFHTLSLLISRLDLLPLLLAPYARGDALIIHVVEY